VSIFFLINVTDKVAIKNNGNIIHEENSGIASVAKLMRARQEK
jgi:hypothetical protein